MIYRTELVNFGTVLYEGPIASHALNEAVRSGFEAIVTNVTVGVSCTYSPLSGWRGKMIPPTNSSGNCRHANDDTC